MPIVLQPHVVKLKATEQRLEERNEVKGQEENVVPTLEEFNLLKQRFDTLCSLFTVSLQADKELALAVHKIAEHLGL